MTQHRRESSSDSVGGCRSSTAWEDPVLRVGNHRGRSHRPRDHGLEIGSEPMLSKKNTLDIPHDRHRAFVRRRSRSLSLSSERRYGAWAQSSIQHLLKQDVELASDNPPVASVGSKTTAGSERGSPALTGATRAAEERLVQVVSPRSGHHSSDPRHRAEVIQHTTTPHATASQAPPQQSVDRDKRAQLTRASPYLSQLEPQVDKPDRQGRGLHAIYQGKSSSPALHTIGGYTHFEADDVPRAQMLRPASASYTRNELLPFKHRYHKANYKRRDHDTGDEHLLKFHSKQAHFQERELPAG